MARKEEPRKPAHVSMKRDEKLKQLSKEQEKASGGVRAAMSAGKTPVLGVMAAPSLVKNAAKEKKLISERRKVEKERPSKYFKK